MAVASWWYSWPYGLMLISSVALCPYSWSCGLMLIRSAWWSHSYMVELMVSWSYSRPCGLVIIFLGLWPHVCMRGLVDSCSYVRPCGLMLIYSTLWPCDHILGLVASWLCSTLWPFGYAPPCSLMLIFLTLWPHAFMIDFLASCSYARPRDYGLMFIWSASWPCDHIIYNSVGISCFFFHHRNMPLILRLTLRPLYSLKMKCTI